MVHICYAIALSFVMPYLLFLCYVYLYVRGEVIYDFIHGPPLALLFVPYAFVLFLCAVSVGLFGRSIQKTRSVLVSNCDEQLLLELDERCRRRLVVLGSFVVTPLSVLCLCAYFLRVPPRGLPGILGPFLSPYDYAPPAMQFRCAEGWLIYGTIIPFGVIGIVATIVGCTSSRSALPRRSPTT